MAFIGIKVPAEIAAALSKIEVPGEKHSPEEMHITLFYMGENMELDQIMKATAACFTVAEKTAPFQVGTALVMSFPPNPEYGYPVIARIQSPGLHEFRKLLAESMDKAGAKYSKKYPEFKPHVTLASSDEESSDTSITPLTWTVSEIILWGGEEDGNRIETKIELLG